MANSQAPLQHSAYKMNKTLVLKTFLKKKNLAKKRDTHHSRMFDGKGRAVMYGTGSFTILR